MSSLRSSRPLNRVPQRPGDTHGGRRRPGWRPPDAPSYAYLLGAYLGDGCVTRMPRTVRLLLALDAAYPGVIGEVEVAMRLSLLVGHVSVRPVKGTGCVRVYSNAEAWLDAFPQWGSGPKHTRPIVLASWQEEIVTRHADWFLRGLIHSDGCRTMNRFTTKLPSGRIAEYCYPRYFFSNLSPDIRGLFCAACDRLGAHWTLPNPRNVSVARRDSVALLDSFVGPKA